MTFPQDMSTIEIHGKAKWNSEELNSNELWLEMLLFGDRIDFG